VLRCSLQPPRRARGGAGPDRLKNLPRQATDALQADGVRAPEIGRVLAHCEHCSMVAGPVAGQPAGRRNKHGQGEGRLHRVNRAEPHH
jgi:hypothetical protein